MYVLDTNVLSAMMRSQPEPQVIGWIGGRYAEELFTTAVCQAEILSGLSVMEEGRRRAGLVAAAQAMFAEDFGGRVLPFDQDAAAEYAGVYAARRRAGRPGAGLDLMIAAIARAHGAAVVTRDIGGFEGCGVTLIDPWALPG